MFASFINPLRFHWNMPKGLKQTSSPIEISTFGVLQTDQVNPQFVSKAVDLQLNPLDNEVFVVTSIKIDFETGMPIPYRAQVGAFSLFQRCSVSTNKQISYRGIDSSSVLSAADLNYYMFTDNAGGFDYILQENNAMDTPPASQDYIGIIATNDFYVNYFCSGEFIVQDIKANVRVYGYRAQADSSTYAALVQSEILSS